MKTTLPHALKGAITVLFLSLHFTTLGQGFPLNATNWPLPPGGEKYNGINYSFHEMAYETGSGDDLGSQSWTIMDMNGDDKLDMVIYEEKQTGGVSVFSPTSNPYWKVYLGTASGFSQTATNWALPPGGEKYNGVNYSFHAMSYDTGSGDDLGSQSWVVMDMNADGRPDIVVYEEKQTGGIGVFSPNANPYWKVYLNTGTGFSQTATNWALPAGGEKYNGINYSFHAISYDVSSADDLGSQSWVVMDMNGDGRPDIAVYEEKQASGIGVFSPNASPYWKVYLNTGTGFSLSATNWALPPGGEKYNGVNYSFHAISYDVSSADDLGSQSWVVMDMNGDAKPDIAVYEEKQASGIGVFSPNANPYWKVYLNTGTGFSLSTTNWSLPAGGEKYNGINYSFHALSYETGSGDDLGSQSWTIMDMNADAKLDIVVYEEKQANGVWVFNPTSNPYWKVYANTGSGFALAATNWALPAGGEKYNGINYSFHAIAYETGSGDDLGSQSWTVMDMNGDARLDLVVYEEKQAAGVRVYSPDANPYWRVFLNNTSTLAVPAETTFESMLTYPNPVTDNLYLQIDEAAIGQTYTVYDMLGKAIKTGNLSETINTIDFGAVTSGLYILKLDGTNGKTIKIVKQ